MFVTVMTLAPTGMHAPTGMLAPTGTQWRHLCGTFWVLCAFLPISIVYKKTKTKTYLIWLDMLFFVQTQQSMMSHGPALLTNGGLPACMPGMNMGQGLPHPHYLPPHPNSAMHGGDRVPPPARVENSWGMPQMKPTPGNNPVRNYSC